jgi:hypothetical protein
MCHGVFYLNASTNHATFFPVGGMREPASVKGFTRSEAENHPLTLEKRPFLFVLLGINQSVVHTGGAFSRVIGYTFKSFPVADPLVKGDNYGINLENYGVPPDVWVQNTPTDEVKGVDRELQAAIDEVMRMLKAGPGVTAGNSGQAQR